MDSHAYVDFHAMGTYNSPQLFERAGAQGQQLPLDQQSWPSDLHTAQLAPRREEVPFWAAIPRKEVSVRGQGSMAPVVLLEHEYTASRVHAVMDFAGFFAMFGLATISADHVSHGLTLTADAHARVSDLLTANDLGPAIDALTFIRGGSLDRQDTVDSGADFWTSYLFHTRDVVRQTVLDKMQLIRVVRSWDGQKTWAPDVNGNGIADDLAGDFDGDGVVDIGRESPILWWELRWAESSRPCLAHLNPKWRR